ncbi:MAG: hypothetical protein KKA97_01870 [Actinobacteria bacterium]|nr:hypothetical protein [Actinomycetota bacterium]
MKLTRTPLATTAVLLCASLAVLPQANAEQAPATAVVGGQTSGDSLFPHQGNTGYDVQHYDVDLAYASNGSITATTTIDAVTTGEPLSEYSLDLEGLTVTAVTVNDAPATFTRLTDEDQGIHKLVVTPAAPVSNAFTTAVTYSGTPTAHTDPDGSMEGWTSTTGGAVALNEPVGAMTWFPNNNTPTDKATFSTALTVPFNAILPFLNRTAVSTGVLDSVTTSGSTRTFTWEQPHQQAPYLSLAAIGRYSGAESDVALSEGTTAEWSYANTLIEGASGFANRRAQLSPMLQSIERSYGTYPGASIGVVVDTSTLGYALETQDRPYFEGSIGQNTLIHELAHQWFGNAVSPSDWSDIWLNEGPATFIATQVEAELYGGDSTEDTYYDLWDSTAAGSAFWTTPVAGFDDPADLFGAPTYNRGAMTLEAMRSALGDEVFGEIMRTWIERYAGGDASTAQWIALSEEISGRDLTAFFTDWLFDTDKPAWPSRWSLDLSSTPATGATLDPEDPFSLTLSATNVGKVAQTGSVVTLDATSLLAQADLDTLPAGVTQSGTTLTWAVPANPVDATTAVTIPATVKTEPPSSNPITLEAYAETLGATCGACTTTLEVDAPQPIEPAPTPAISGVLRLDRQLTATVGDWPSGADLDYQWLRDGSPIDDATDTTYDLTLDDLGARMRFEVSATQEGFLPTTRTSEPTAAVGKGVQSKRKRPGLDGVARVGRPLRALVPARDAGTTTTYQWLAGKKPIKKATSRWYTITKKQRGKRLRVQTTTTKTGYHDVVRVSLRTKKVKKRN